VSSSLQLWQFNAQLDYKAILREIGSHRVDLQMTDAIDFHVLDEESSLDAIVGVPKDAPFVEVRINGVHIVLRHSLVPQPAGKRLKFKKNYNYIDLNTVYTIKRS